MRYSGRDFLHASVRGLYKYVMEAITTPYKVPTATNNDDGSTATPSTSPRNNTFNNEPTATAPNDDDNDDEMSSREDLTYRERLGT